MEKILVSKDRLKGVFDSLVNFYENFYENYERQEREEIEKIIDEVLELLAGKKPVPIYY